MPQTAAELLNELQQRAWVQPGVLASLRSQVAKAAKPVTPADLRIWTWSALARGAKAIATYAFYPMSSGYESGGFGLVELDGTLTERAKTAGAIARLVGSHSPLFLAARPVPAQVAVVYNPLSHFVGGRQRAAAYGGPQGEIAGIERDSLLGIYRALFPSNVPIDYVHADHLKAAELASYRLVVLPYTPMMRASAASELREYVRAGGTLVLEARAGWNDDSGRAASVIPGLGLAEVAGARRLVSISASFSSSRRARTTAE